MNDCIFCKIINREIPATIVYENDTVLVFNDLSPQAPTHLLAIPKTHISSVNDIQDSQNSIIGNLFIAAKECAQKLGFAESGYRCVMNTGEDGGQTVFHIHLHILAGRSLSWPPG